MGKIIAIANQKGGVGKTTTVINLGAALARKDKKVLIIDLDEQANATLGLGLSPDYVVKGAYDLFVDDININDTINVTSNNNLDIIPSTSQLANVEEKLQNIKNKKCILKDKLSYLKNDYDYVLIDCPSTFGTITDNALFLSDSVIIPVECEFLAYNGLNQMIQKIYQIQKEKNEMNLSLTIDGVLLTKLDNRNLFGYKIKEKVMELFPNKTYKTIIKRSSHLQEAPMHGKSVLDFAYNSRGSKEYRELADEIINNSEERK